MQDAKTNDHCDVTLATQCFYLVVRFVSLHLLFVVRTVNVNVETGGLSRWQGPACYAVGGGSLTHPSGGGAGAPPRGGVPLQLHPASSPASRPDTPDSI